MPKERKKDQIIIGKNIKAIKEINHLTWEQFGALVGISSSKLTKIEGGSVEFSDDDLYCIYRATSIHAELIKTCDPDEFKRILSNPYFASSNIKSLKDFFSDEKFSFISEAMLDSFPFEYDQKCLKSKSFVNAYNFVIRIPLPSKEDVDYAIDLFLKSTKEGASAAAYVNIQSFLALHYLLISTGSNNENEATKLLEGSATNNMVAFKTLEDNIKKNIVEVQNNIKAFYDAYSDLLDECFEKTLRSKKYKEYAEFFLVMRYHYRILPLDFKMSNKEIDSTYEHLMDFLLCTNNKYAILLMSKLKEKFTK